jgi:hypothetical protein
MKKKDRVTQNNEAKEKQFFKTFFTLPSLKNHDRILVYPKSYSRIENMLSEKERRNVFVIE